MLQFHYKFIKRHIFLICFLILFFGNKYIYATQRSINASYLPEVNTAFINQNRGDFASNPDENNVVRIRFNLTQALSPYHNINSFNALSAYYSHFRFSDFPIQFYIVRIEDNEIIDGSEINKNDVIFDISNLAYRSKIFELNYVCPHVTDPNGLYFNKLNIYMNAVVAQNQENDLELIVSFKAKGFTEPGKRFTVTAQPSQQIILTTRS